MQRFDVLIVWSFVFIFLAAIVGLLPRETIAIPDTEASKLLALTGYFSESVDLDQLKETFGTKIKDVRNESKIKVLIVPGHDDKNVGAVFGDIREVDLNRELALSITEYLKSQPAFDVMLASDARGWNQKLETFFAEEKDAITTFQLAHKEATKKLEPVLDLKYNPDVIHNEATEDVVHSLYGINKFANDQEFDIVLHVHFNDYPNRRAKKEGKYEGFAIYTPLAQFSNGRASQRLARHIFTELQTIRPISTLPIESAGIIEDGELIAIGAYNTAKAISLLIEYGFIYEPDIADETLREQTFDRMAAATAQGVQSFLSTKY